MLVIRLQRTGKKNAAAYRVVLAEKQKAVGGKIIETLGFHNPRTKENAFKDERIKYWLSQGAKALPTVHNLLVEKKIIEGKKVKAWTPKKKPAVAEGSGVAMPAAEASSSAKAAEDTVGEAKPVTEEKPVEGAAKPVEEAAEPEAKAEEPVSSEDKPAEEKKEKTEVKEEKPVEDETKTEETK